MKRVMTKTNEEFFRIKHLDPSTSFLRLEYPGGPDITADAYPPLENLVRIDQCLQDSTQGSDRKASCPKPSSADATLGFL